jgi:dihydrofolate synthase/folylpolyglutamate synthase
MNAGPTPPGRGPPFPADARGSETDVAARALFRRTTHGIRPGLEIIHRLLERRDHPERNLLCLHVAGTNGKGSVCAMLERLLRAAGFRTGLYTSPHLVSLNERIRIDGRPTPDADLLGLMRDWEREAIALEREEELRPATFFEITTAMALDHFRREGVEATVIETGMGGRWDATNVVRPAVSVISTIDFDHMEFLGRTLTEIAGEKAGIIKGGRPVVIGTQPDEAMERLLTEAREVGAPVRRAEEMVSARRIRQDWSGQTLRLDTASGVRATVLLPLLGAHQIRNVLLAAAALETFLDLAGASLTEPVLVEGFSRICWPARLQVLERDPPVLLDGAHNPQGARALSAALRDLADGRPAALVCGMMSTKDTDGFLRALSPAVRRGWAVDFPNEGALPRGDLLAGMRAAGIEAEAAGLDEALADARRWAAEKGGLVCIAGSLYLAGEILRRRGIDDLFSEPGPPGKRAGTTR